MAYNPLTVAKAVYYTDNYWGKEKTEIIYLPTVCEVPANILRNYDYVVVPYQEKHCHNKKLNSILKIIARNKAALYIKKTVEVAAANNSILLVVFTDNDVFSTTCMEKLKSKYKRNLKVLLIEEGAGIYSEATQDHTKKHWKYKLIDRLMGVSLYHLNERPQGLHSLLDGVICEQPKLFEKKRNKLEIDIIQQDDLFRCEFSKRICSMALGDDVINESIEYVFLTCPWDDIANIISLDEYKAFLKELFDNVSKAGNVLIKKHPRDHFDFSTYLSESVFIEEKINQLPFEALYCLLGRPTLISIISSACSCDKTKTSYFLYPYLNNYGVKFEVCEGYLHENNIKLCSSVRELMKCLYASK